ncbi:hypothetical protein ACJX0J_039791, partial [Zea mays]
RFSLFRVRSSRSKGGGGWRGVRSSWSTPSKGGKLRLTASGRNTLTESLSLLRRPRGVTSQTLTRK